jgi:hypothetical protein
MGGKRQAAWPFSLLIFLFTPGILPYAIRASSLFAHASCVLVVTQRESDSASEGGRKLLLCAQASLQAYQLEVRCLPSQA